MKQDPTIGPIIAHNNRFPKPVKNLLFRLAYLSLLYISPSGSYLDINLTSCPWTLFLREELEDVVSILRYINVSILSLVTKVEGCCQNSQYSSAHLSVLPSLNPSKTSVTTHLLCLMVPYLIFTGCVSH